MKFAFAPESKPLEGYTIKRAIHRGGFGEVYYALTDAGKEVALKLLRQNMEIELRGVSQCLNLKHSNLVTIFDIKTDADGDHWIIMEYVSGQTLDEIMEQYPKGMPIPEVQKWMSGFLKGLAFLHDRGIVHRDLKPANLFTEDDEIKIGDIGLSKFITQSRRSAQTQSVGTVYYMAPEVAHGKYGHEVDIYALGVILYEMLTGHVPFEGESTGEILMKHLTEKPNVNALPPQYQQMVAQALEKDPLKRTSSVALFAQQFQEAGGKKVDPLEIPAFSFNQPEVVAANTKTRRFGEDGINAPESKSVPPPFPEASPNNANKTHKNYQHSPPPQNPQPYQTGPTPGAGLSGKVTYNLGQVLGRVNDWWRAQTTPIQVLLFAFLILTIQFWLPFLLVTIIAGGVLLVVLLVVDLFTGAINYSTPHVPTPPPPPENRSNTETKAEFASHAEKLHPHPEVDAYRKKYREKFHRKEKLRNCQPNSVRRLNPIQKLTELFSSLSLSAIYVAIFTVVSQMAMSNEFAKQGATPAFWSETIYFGVIYLLSIWGILIISKFLEGSEQPGFIRRILMLPVALGVAFAASGLRDYLLVPFSNHYSYEGGIQQFFDQRLTVLNAWGVAPSYWGFALFLLGMMFLRQWWLLCDNYRLKFFRIASVLFSVGLALVWTLIFSFPMEIALIWSAMVSIVLQLVSPWTPPEKRMLTKEGV